MYVISVLVVETGCMPLSLLLVASCLYDWLPLLLLGASLLILVTIFLQCVTFPSRFRSWYEYAIDEAYVDCFLFLVCVGI
jgi:hypothetical protein